MKIWMLRNLMLSKPKNRFDTFPLNIKLCCCNGVEGDGERSFLRVTKAKSLNIDNFGARKDRASSVVPEVT